MIATLPLGSSGDGSGGHNIPVCSNALIVGPSGTGKKTIALYRAKLIHDLGRPVEVLTYSRCQSAYLQGAACALGLEDNISTFHNWFGSFYRRCHGTRPPEVREFEYDWPRILRALAASPHPKASLPHLVIMEAQDLPSGFWMVVPHLARHVTAFADDTSCIYGARGASLQEIIAALGPGAALIRLTRNYRNTFEIAALATSFVGEAGFGAPDLPVRHGALPVVWKVSGVAASVDLMVRYEHEHAELELGILVPTSRMGKTILERMEGRTVNRVQSCFGGSLSGAEPPVFAVPGIRVCTSSSAKGLEFDTVFLPEFQTYSRRMDPPHFRGLMYSMLSRARSDVFIFYSGNEPLEPDTFGPGLVEWR